MEVDQFSDEHGLNSPTGDARSVSSSLREVAKLAAAKEAAVTKSSSFGLIALQDKLSFHHWSMIDATPAEIKLLVADVVAYKWNVAARMIVRFWRRYIFLTRAKTLVVTSQRSCRRIIHNTTEEAAHPAQPSDIHEWTFSC